MTMMGVNSSLEVGPVSYFLQPRPSTAEAHFRGCCQAGARQQFSLPCTSSANDDDFQNAAWRRLRVK